MTPPLKYPLSEFPKVEATTSVISRVAELVMYINLADCEPVRVEEFMLRLTPDASCTQESPDTVHVISTLVMVMSWSTVTVAGMVQRQLEISLPSKSHATKIQINTESHHTAVTPHIYTIAGSIETWVTLCIANL